MMQTGDDIRIRSYRDAFNLHPRLTLVVFWRNFQPEIEISLNDDILFFQFAQLSRCHVCSFLPRVKKVSHPTTGYRYYRA